MADENTDLRCYLTNAGIAAENNSIQLNRSLNVTEMVFGSGVLADESDPRAQTAMISEEYAVPCAMLFDEANPTLLVFKSDLPADVGGFHINEVGIRLEDGTIYGYARGKGDYKPTLEQGATDSVRYAVEMYTNNAGIIETKIDLSSVYADYEDLTNLETNLLETVNNLDAQNVKLTGNQTIAGSKTFSSPVPVATPTANAHATTKAYVDGLLSGHKAETDPHTQYLTRADFLKHMLFKGMPMSAVGPDPDPDIWLPAGRVELLRADYPTVFEIVSASDFFTDQATIDADPRAYAGHWGTGDGATTFTTDDWALMMNIKVAGGYGAAGSTKEDHLQNIMASVTGNLGIGSSDGAFVASNSGPNNTNGGTAFRTLTFDASLVSRTDTYTDTMGLFLDHYRVIPKGVFSYA